MEIMENGEEFVRINTPPNNARIANIKIFFENEFECKPSFIVKVPGRVNIIGEHIDYCGYPVMPMALEQDILLAVAFADEQSLLLRNLNGAYIAYNGSIKEFEIENDEQGKPLWYSYVLCGLKGAIAAMSAEFVNKPLNGLKMVVSGNIPPASGLSSSSALVSAAVLAFLHAHQCTASKVEMASLCARSERYIGTEGGGMDQAIAFLAKRGCAQYITWNPLAASPVQLPPDAVFVVAHSMAEANKAATNDFNRRVIECRLSAKIIAKKYGLKDFNNAQITLSYVQNQLNLPINKMIEILEETIPENVYSREDVCRELEITDEELTMFHLTKNTRHLNEFKLKQRALHVYEEALRVDKFKTLCDTNDKHINEIQDRGKDDQDKIKMLGTLMRDSHSSLQKLYECSHEELDRLVKLSDDFGVCARLTGAGWGGCIVALCPQSKIDAYIDFLRSKFYLNHPKLQGDDTSNLLFATSPNHGAEIYQSDEY